jgi:hypothetical protein
MEPTKRVEHRIHGDEVPYDFTVPQGRRKLETLWDEYETALAEARAILARKVVPLPAYSGVCKLCYWRHTFFLDRLISVPTATPRYARAFLREGQRSLAVMCLAFLCGHI